MVGEEGVSSAEVEEVAYAQVRGLISPQLQLHGRQKG